jgi:hypothetical protein
MRKSTVYFLITSFYLRINLLEKGHPDQIRINVTESSSLMIVCKYWQVVIYNDLLRLAIDTYVKFVGSNLTDF